MRSQRAESVVVVVGGFWWAQPPWSGQWCHQELGWVGQVGWQHKVLGAGMAGGDITLESSGATDSVAMVVGVVGARSAVVENHECRYSGSGQLAWEKSGPTFD